MSQIRIKRSYETFASSPTTHCSPHFASPSYFTNVSATSPLPGHYNNTNASQNDVFGNVNQTNNLTNKRLRTDSPPTSPVDSHMISPISPRSASKHNTLPTRTTNSSAIRTRDESPFKSIPLPDIDVFLSSKKRAKYSHSSSVETDSHNKSSVHNTVSTIPTQTSNSPIYTVEEVKRLLSEALTDRDQMLRDEYDRILTERLNEQFQSFSRFYEDCISRRSSKNEFSYVS
jgi:hypothetical protein